MPLPPFVGRRREAPRVEHPFVLAQVRQEAQLFRERVYAGESAAAFFLHGGKVAEFCPRGKRGTRRWNEEQCLCLTLRIP